MDAVFWSRLQFAVTAASASMPKEDTTPDSEKSSTSAPWLPETEKDSMMVEIMNGNSRTE